MGNANPSSFYNTTALPVQVAPTTPVALLPSASACQGAGYMASDATATTFWSVVVGGGSNIIRVTSDGTNWRIG